MGAHVVTNTLAFETIHLVTSICEETDQIL